MLDDQKLIERVITVINALCSEILVVTSKEQLKTIEAENIRARIVIDSIPGKSSLVGLYTGLKFSDTFYNLVVACDMPFLCNTLLTHLIDIAPGFDAIVPRFGMFLEPLHAIYTKNCLAIINEMIQKNTLSITRIFDMVSTRYVDEEEINRFDPNHMSFVNINTEQDLNEAIEIIKSIKNDKQECR